MLTLLDHSRYAFFRNRSIVLCPNGVTSPAKNLHFWRWWQNGFVPVVLHLAADMPRHNMLPEYRCKGWRKSAPGKHAVRNKRRSIRGQRMRGCMGVFLSKGRLS